jgi:hypothetical protein
MTPTKAAGGFLDKFATKGACLSYLAPRNGVSVWATSLDGVDHVLALRDKADTLASLLAACSCGAVPGLGKVDARAHLQNRLTLATTRLPFTKVPDAV